MKGRQFSAGVTIIALGWFSTDTQADSVRFTVTSDSRDCEGCRNVLDAVNDLAGGPGGFIITVGDMDPLEEKRAWIDEAFGEPNFPWYPVIGNHEQEDPDDVNYLRDFYWNYLEGFVNPGPAGSTEMTYSFDAGPTHIVVLNVYWDGTTNPDADIARDGDVVLALRDWVEADLAASSQPWKLLFFHEPAYPQADEQWGDARHAGDSLDYYATNRDEFWRVLEENGANACFTAHTHRYSSYRPTGSPVWQIDSAQARGGDCPWPEDPEEEYDAFLIVEADNENITVEVYRMLLSGEFLLLETLDLGGLPPTELVSFPQDPNGTVDTMLHEAFPEADYSEATQLHVEDDAGEVQALIRFEDIVGEEPGHIPLGTRIVSAALKFYTINATPDEVNVNRVLVPWEDTDTWDSMNDGVSSEDGEAASYFDAVLPGEDLRDTWNSVDVTASLRAWVEYGDANHGWVLLPTGANGWEFYSSEGDYPPQLSVEYDACPSQFARFQQDSNGYGGTLDTMLREAEPNEPYGTHQTLIVDADDDDHETQALIRFEEIVGAGPGQIPTEAAIVAAKLRLYTTEDTEDNNVMFHRMLGVWEDTDTWNSMDYGISADGNDAVIAADTHLPPDDRELWWHEVDVTASLRAWVEDGEVNLGWAMLPTGDESWQFRSAESTMPPQLVVWYRIVGDLDGDGDVDLADLADLLGSYGTCIGDEDHNPCTDLDDSGCIDLADLAELLGHYGVGT